MRNNNIKYKISRLKYDGFFLIAFWELMSFILLILLIWVNEIMDLSALWFGVSPELPNFYRGCGLTIGVITIAIITIGNTYIHQKQIIKRLIIICSRCRKMRVDEHAWEHLDQYLGDQSLARISHGLCPDCFEQAKREIEERPEAKLPDSNISK